MSGDRYQLRFRGYKPGAPPTHRFELLGWVRGDDVASLLASSALIAKARAFEGYEVHLDFEVCQ